LFFLTLTLRAFSDTYPEVLFENSVLRGNYAYSEVHHDTLSWVENVQGRLPVSDTLFFTPGNALSLKYSSAANGNWHVDITYPDRSAGYRLQKNDILTFKLFVASATGAAALPRLAIYQSDTLSDSVDLSPYIQEFQPNTWLNVQIPLKAISGVLPDRAVSAVRLSQGRPDSALHWLYIDQIEFLPDRLPRVKLTSPAVLSAAKAYERHVDLSWQLPLTPSIRYIKIYRSEDNEHFEPVAIRPIFVQRCTDFVPQTDKAYYYKIAWVDYDYLESPFSDVVKAEVKPTGDEEFLDIIQAAHFNYFMERAEVNSGMHGVQFGVDDATVSVMETGLSVLAHLVAAEREFISRSAVASRIERMVDFLSKAERYHGAFPARLDGRTGKGVYKVDSVPEADLRATAFLMQGLLAARQYFEEEPWTGKIDSLWQDVEWTRFTLDEQEHILLDRWSPAAGFTYARPMGGFNDGFIAYVLSLASPMHHLQSEAYASGLGTGRQLTDSMGMTGIASNEAFSVKLDSTAPGVLPAYREFPYRNDTTLYGLPVAVGSVDTSLLEAYKPFLALDPRNKHDQFADYFTNHVNLIQGYQRRDNAIGTGSSLLDIWGLTKMNGLPDTSWAVNPALAVASYAYRPTEALRSLRAFYNSYGHALFTEYGFRNWISFKENAVADTYDAVSQASVVVMIENGRSGLIWKLFSEHPDIKKVINNHFSVQ